MHLRVNESLRLCSLIKLLIIFCANALCRYVFIWALRFMSSCLWALLCSRKLVRRPPRTALRRLWWSITVDKPKLDSSYLVLPLICPCFREMQPYKATWSKNQSTYATSFYRWRSKGNSGCAILAPFASSSDRPAPEWRSCPLMPYAALWMSNQKFFLKKKLKRFKNNKINK